jgi:hypothetical protein
MMDGVSQPFERPSQRQFAVSFRDGLRNVIEG